MYWTLETRPPTLDEIIADGERRIRLAVENACSRYEAPQIERPDSGPKSSLPRLDEAALLMQMKYRQQAAMRNVGLEGALMSGWQSSGVAADPKVQFGDRRMGMSPHFSEGSLLDSLFAW